MPSRIQRKRTNGWRMPPGAVYVGRPTVWGNPFRVGQPTHDLPHVVWRLIGSPDYGPLTQAQAVNAYRVWLSETSTGRAIAAKAREKLAGHDLACWCPPEEPCHADILLKVANDR